LGEGDSEFNEPVSRPIEPPEEQPPRLDPLQRLRQVAGQPEPEDRVTEEEVIEAEQEPLEISASEPKFVPRADYSESDQEPSQRPSLLSRKLVPPVSGEFRRSRVEMLQESDDDISLWSTDQEPKKRPSREIKTVSSNTLRRVGIGLAAVLIPAALLGVALGPGRPFIEDFVNNLSAGLQASSSNGQPTTSLIDETPFVAPTLPPLGGTDESEACVSWEEVTSEMQGETLCVEGVIRRWFSIPDMPFVAIFTEDLGTFAIVDRLGTHPEVRPGSCLRVTGPVEVMRGPRPFIDIQGEVEFCESE
jgi:hypothetical protein